MDASAIDFEFLFEKLDQLLSQYDVVWRDLPFTSDVLSWQTVFPQLHHALLELSDEQLVRLSDETRLLAWLATYLPALTVVSQITIPSFDVPIRPMVKFTDVGVPGRKKNQIVGFVSALNAFMPRSSALNSMNTANRILDWCSGKGHLAKHLHQVIQRPVTCLEYDPVLCAAGQQEVAKNGSEIEFEVQDVLQPLAQKLTKDVLINTALHACGDLHLTMMRCAVTMGSAQIAVAPCCYHLINDDHYQPLSARAKRSLLVLDKTDLRLAVLQTVTGGARVKRLREQELLWRIAFDLWLRQSTGIDHYQPTVSLNKQWFSGEFIDFCQRMAIEHPVPLPTETDIKIILTQAEGKLAAIKRLEQARLGFRKALEYWLIFDRALYLQEQGYKVKLGRFCGETDSPRNILLVGNK